MELPIFTCSDPDDWGVWGTACGYMFFNCLHAELFEKTSKTFYWLSFQKTDIASDLEDKDPSGPRLNIKTVLSTYGDFHLKDKTAVRTSYL